MTIQNLIINGISHRNQDFLDLILSLKDSSINSITVIYKNENKITSTKTTVYERTPQGWVRTLDKGVECNTPIRVTKVGKYHIIENI